MAKQRITNTQLNNLSNTGSQWCSHSNWSMGVNATMVSDHLMVGMDIADDRTRRSKTNLKAGKAKQSPGCRKRSSH